MENPSQSIAVPPELIIELPFLEEYQKANKDNLKSEEFMIKKFLEGSKDQKLNYSSVSELPKSHNFKVDYKNME
jgi:hypothetical protein